MPTRRTKDQTADAEPRQAETSARAEATQLAPSATAPIVASDPAVAREFAIEAARMVKDDKCDDVVLLDVRALSQVTDYIVVASGTSARQMKSILEHVEELGQKYGYRAFASSVDENASWILVDFIDLVVHLFEPNTRAHYDLEMLWGDADRVEWERPDQQTRDRAGLGADKKSR
ncbi:MAG: ribosome silencing factor [Phycisphaerales bacterium]|nr:MAG: ribosome silencing factor [Phycisphaerales bacterium]